MRSNGGRKLGSRVPCPCVFCKSLRPPAPQIVMKLPFAFAQGTNGNNCDVARDLSKLSASALVDSLTYICCRRSSRLRMFISPQPSLPFVLCALCGERLLIFG
jgi:hypothetical protein